MPLYYRLPPEVRVEFKQKVAKLVENTRKSLLLLALPIPATLLILAIWYYLLYKNQYFFPGSEKDIVVVIIIGVMTIFGIVYAVQTAKLVDIVYTEFKRMQLALKCSDFETFMELRDENISPVLHVVLSILALFEISGTMGLPYPNATIGFYVVGSLTYTFALNYWVIKEIDNPCKGIWVIKSLHGLHKDWLKADPKAWRQSKFEAAANCEGGPPWKLVETTTTTRTIERVEA